MLRLVGCEPLLALSGDDTLALCARQGAHLAAVILDLHLPGEDAAALFDALRARRPDLPIILTSGLPDGAARECLGRSDLTRFLPKPFRREELLKTLDGALEGRPAPAGLPAAPTPHERGSGIRTSREHPEAGGGTVMGEGGSSPRRGLRGQAGGAPRAGGTPERRRLP